MAARVLREGLGRYDRGVARLKRPLVSLELLDLLSPFRLGPVLKDRKMVDQVRLEDQVVRTENDDAAARSSALEESRDAFCPRDAIEHERLVVIDCCAEVDIAGSDDV